MDKELSKDAENASSANLTAVDFLIQEIKADALVCVKSIDEWNQVFKKAKEMEKKQIIDAHNNGYGSGYMDEGISPEEFYNKAKENLYTEEQVRKAYFKGAADVHDKCTDRTWRGVETKVDIELLKKLNAEYIQSLKQPKQ